MEKHQIIHKFRVENLSQKKGCGCKKKGFPVPSPEGSEDEQGFISRCMRDIGGEYDQDQALAICYSKWRGE